MINHYNILKVSRMSSNEEIKSKAKKLLKEVKTSKILTKDKNNLSKKIYESYQFLRDYHKRKSLDDYFGRDVAKMIVRQPLVLTNKENAYDADVKVEGGGSFGQAGAIRLAISKALIAETPDLRGELKKAGYLTRDSRVKERKKVGLKKARKSPQFSKR